MNPYVEEIVALRQRIEELEAENAALYDELAVPDWLPLKLHFGLTRAQAKILSFLAARTLAQRDAIYWHLYQNATREPKIETVDQLVYHMRRRIARFDLTVETVWGVGYRMPKAHRERIKALAADTRVTTLERRKAWAAETGPSPTTCGGI